MPADADRKFGESSFNHEHRSEPYLEAISTDSGAC
jgi:hypothetical protein